MEKFQSFWAVVSPIVLDIGNMFGSVLTAAIGGMVNFAVSGIDVILGAVDSLTVVLGGLIDFITGIFTGNWEKAWNGVSTIFTGITDGIKGVFKGTINGVINAVNGFLTGLNGIKIPDWVPKVGGKSFSIPLIPALARGTDSWGGGIAQVHERGGEIIDLPRGSRVYPHDESIRKARNEGKRISFSIDKLADTIIVREEEDIDKIADRLYRKLVQAEANMGGVTFDGNMA